MKINSVVTYNSKYYYIAKTYSQYEGMLGLKPLDVPKKNCIIVHKMFLTLVQE